MKRSRLSFLFILIVFILLSGCSENAYLYNQAKDRYKKGRIESSFYLVAKSLQRKPSYQKALLLIEETYPKAVAQREENIERLLLQSDGDKFDKIVLEYEALDELSKTYRKLPELYNPKTGYFVRLEAKDYSYALNEAKVNAAEYHYQKGINLKNSSDDLGVQKKAAIEFKTAMSYVTDYKESALFYEQSRRKAVKRLAVFPLEDKSGLRQNYSALGEMLSDAIISGVMRQPGSNEFIEIIARNQIDAITKEQLLSSSGLFDESSFAQYGSLLGAHEILTGKISQIIFTAPYVSRTRKTEKNKVKTGEEEVENEDGEKEKKDIIEELSCEYSLNTKTAAVKMTVSYSILEVGTGKIRKQNSFSKDYSFSQRWAVKLSGDERALTGEAKDLIKISEPKAPSEAELLDRVSKLIQPALVNDILEYIK